MSHEFVEPDCTVTHEGRNFTSGGASLVGNRLVAYLGDAGNLTTWHGDVIGTYRIVSTWRTPRSFLSSTMSSVVAKVGDTFYIGRSAGKGMAFSGKVKAKQNW